MSDLVVVGGGPSGLATAIAARQADLSVVVLERGRPPLDKACGEGLMPGGVAALEKLGVELDPSGRRPFRGIRYFDLDSGAVAEGVFFEGPGLGVRRTVLHAALVQRAAQLGADLRWGVRVTGLERGGVQTDRGRADARWIVGADGLHSRVARWAGLDARPGPRRFGVRRHFEVEPWADFVDVHWRRGVEAYITPVGEREVGVALLTGDEPLVFDDLLAKFPALAEQLVGRRRTSELRGAGPFHRRVRRVWSGDVTLVGDAAGYLDPITGEGLGTAFRQALALVHAVTRDDLALYARAHRRIIAGYWRTTALLLFVQRRPRWRSRSIRALARHPTVFARILAAHNGSIPLRAIGMGGAARLTWAAIRG